MPRRASKTGKKRPVLGKRYPLNMRTTFDIRLRLEEAAASSGRSLAQEAEARIERSFRDQGLLVDALELAYGRGLAGILLAIGEAMKLAGRQAGFHSTRTLQGADNWWDDPYAFDQATKAATVLLNEFFRPAGEIQLPRFAFLKGGPPDLDLQSAAENTGTGAAFEIVNEIASEEGTSTTTPALRESLGVSLVERVRQRRAVRPATTLLGH